MFAQTSIGSWRRALFASALLVTGTALAASGRAAAQGGATAAESAHAPVQDAQPIVLPARVVAYQAALITAKVAGYVARIPVDKGDQVRAGQLLAQLDVPELQADRLRYVAEADVAKQNYQRMLRAVKVAPDLVTPERVEIQRGKVEVAQAQLARVDALLRYSRVTAPFSGTITARYVDPGAFVPVPNGGAQSGGQIVMLMSLDRVRIQIPVPESEAPLIKAGCKVMITVPDLHGVRFAATVTRVSDALSSKSQTMLAEIDMPNPHHRLLPGMYLSVSLTPQHRVQAQRTAMSDGSAW